jgi:hypothetical protein
VFLGVHVLNYLRFFKVGVFCLWSTYVLNKNRHRNETTINKKKKNVQVGWLLGIQILPTLNLVFKKWFSSGLPDGICIFKTKTPIWVNFGVSCNERYLDILLPFGLFYCHLVYFIAIWNILLPFGIFYGRLVHFVVILGYFFQFGYIVPKNLATLVLVIARGGRLALFEKVRSVVT